MPTSTRIKPWQAKGKSWSAASTAFWTPCKSNIRCPVISRAMKQPPSSKQSHGLADQQCTLTYNMYHSVNIMLVPLWEMKLIFAGCACCFVLLNICVCDCGRGFCVCSWMQNFFLFKVAECQMQSSLSQSTKLLPFHIHLQFLESGLNLN